MRWLRSHSKTSRSRIPSTAEENDHVVDKAPWTAERSDCLDRIYQQTALPKEWFEQLIQIPLKRYAAHVQHKPAQLEPYAYPGGFLDHSLALIEGALRLRHSRLLPAGAAPEEQAHQAEAWSTALVYAALLDELHTLPQAPIARDGINLELLVDESIRDWLQGFPELWSQLDTSSTYPRSQADALGELIDQARLALNGPQPASQGQRVVSEAMDAPAIDDCPHQDPAVAYSVGDSAAENYGRAFLLWLEGLISEEQLSVNQENSKVHVMEGEAFICSPVLFQQFCRELKADSLPGACRLEWRGLQRRFEALQIHRKSPDGRNLWNCSLGRSGRMPRRLTGYLVKADVLFASAPPGNPSLCLLTRP